MKWKCIAPVSVIMFFVMTAGAQPIVAESAPFTFPAEVGVKISAGVPAASRYFRYSGPVLKAGAVTFSWSFPAQHRNGRGAITVYSLSGRAIAVIPVSANAGSVRWNFTGQRAGGVYIVRIVCGADRQSLRLLLCG